MSSRAASGLPTIRTVVSPAPTGAWSALATADPLTMPSQTPEWIAAMVSTGRFRDRSRLYTFDDGRRFAVPLISYRNLARPIAGLSSLPNAWGAGGVVGVGRDPGVMRRIVDDLVGTGTLRLQIRPNPLQTEEFSLVLPGSAIRHRRRAHIARLPADTDTLWHSVFVGKTRRALNRAQRSGVEVEHDTTGRLASVYDELRLRSVERWAGRQHEPRFLAKLRAEHRDPLSKWQAIARHLDGGCHFYVARVEGRPVCAVIVLRGTNAHYTRSVMDKAAAAPVYAGELLLFRAMSDAIDAGCTWFHMGETGLMNPGLARFKEKFGAEAHDHADFLIERLPITAADRLARNAVKRLVGFRD